MKVKIPFTNKNLYIEDRYSSEYPIVSLGCDCHPAYVLDTLHLRKFSLPFDWLKTEPVEGLYYAAANFTNDFENFLKDLIIKENAKVVSNFFPFSEFFHDTDLIDNHAVQERYQRKIERLTELRKNKRIAYLYTIPVLEIRNIEKASYFLESVHQFINVIKPIDTIHLYFRTEDDEESPETTLNYFLYHTESMPAVTISHYVRGIETFGIWGNEKDYRILLRDLKINIKKAIIPEIYLSNY